MRQSRNDCIDQCTIKGSPEKKTATLFSEQAMADLVVKILDPGKKERKLFQRYSYKYRQFHYTSNQTAELLGISLKALKALRDQGEIQYEKTGGKVQFYAGDIYRFLQECHKRQK